MKPCVIFLFCVCASPLARAAAVDSIWSKLIPVINEYHPIYRGQKPNITHTSMEVVDHSAMEFCDGAASFTATRAECKYGYQFGQRIPTCLCFKGLYRMILDDCYESDGLSEGEICTKPFDTQRESGAKIYTVQITQEINWDHTHVVCEKEERAGSKIWSATPLHGNDKMVSVMLPAEEPDFYVINGVPYMVDVAANKQAICVEQKYVSSFKQEKICRYFRNDNDAWRTEKTVEITIRADKCPSNGKLMIPSECFPSERESSSECQLSCGKTDFSKLLSRVAGPGILRSNEALNQSSNFLEELFVSPEAPSNIRYDNLFLDRKMLQHLLVSNIRTIKPLEALQPNRSFELFSRMVTVTTSFCPEKYIHAVWINSVIELFKLIHHGNGLNYTETLNEADFNWTRDILDKCIATATAKPIILTLKPTEEEVEVTDGEQPEVKPEQTDDNDTCANDGDQVWGYCPEGKCDILHAKEIRPCDSKSPAILKSKHYVPELAWNVLDISQAICFEDFNSSYRMFHIVQQSIENLFTEQIRNLWNYPPYNDPGSKVKQQLLGAGSDVEMYNLEVCTASVYDLVNTAHLRKYGDKATPIARLKRPDPESELRKRKKRSAKMKSISTGVDAYCLQKSKDFKYPESCFRH